MKKWVARPAAKNDGMELVRLAWCYGETGDASEIQAAIRQVMTGLQQRGDYRALAVFLGLPDYPQMSLVLAEARRQLVVFGPVAGPAIVSLATSGRDETKRHAISVLEEMGEKDAAAGLRHQLEAEEARRQRLREPDPPKPVIVLTKTLWAGGSMGLVAGLAVNWLVIHSHLVRGGVAVALLLLGWVLVGFGVFAARTPKGAVAAFLAVGGVIGLVGLALLAVPSHSMTGSRIAGGALLGIGAFAVAGGLLILRYHVRKAPTEAR